MRQSPTLKSFVAFLECVLFTLVFPLGTIGCRDAVPMESKLEAQKNETSARTVKGAIRSIDDWMRLNRSKPVRRIVCSGSGALRLATYLQASDRVVAVEQVEKTKTPVAPYRLVRTEYGDLPVFGEGHGRDNVEYLLSLNPPPDVIIRVDSFGAGIDPDVLQERTGIPVVVVKYGDLGACKELFNDSLRFLGVVLDKRERAEELIAFTDSQIAELGRRTNDIPDKNRPVAYLGGLSFRGTFGIGATATDYPPFDWIRLRNPASELKTSAILAVHTVVSPEQLVAWNPDFIFVDLGTLGATDDGGGWRELTTNPIYQSVAAVQNGRVSALYPNNSYNGNFEAILVNAWRIGKNVWPDRFADVEIAEKSDEICRFFLGEPARDKAPERLKSRLYRSNESEPNVAEVE